MCIRDRAERAGLSQATLFKYFKTKDDLLTAILHPVVPGIFGSFFEELLAFETTEAVSYTHLDVYKRQR